MVNGTEIIGASCSNPSEYISWDGVHYSHAANKWIANQILNGKLSNPPIPITGACHKLGHSWSQALSSNGYLAIMQWKSLSSIRDAVMFLLIIHFPSHEIELWISFCTDISQICTEKLQKKKINVVWVLLYHLKLGLAKILCGFSWKL